MYIQEYGDKTMAGFWNWITNGLKQNIQRQNAGSSGEYKNAFNQANESIGQTQQKVDQYTGNEGYGNTLEQAGKGAATIAGQAVGTATQGARNAGMSKAQAAAMGNQTANNVYANAFQGQQGIAQSMGNQAIQGQQGITQAQQSQAGQAQSEKQATYDRARNNAMLAADMVGRIGTGLGNM